MSTTATRVRTVHWDAVSQRVEVVTDHGTIQLSGLVPVERLGLRIGELCEALGVPRARQLAGAPALVFSEQSDIVALGSDAGRIEAFG